MRKIIYIKVYGVLLDLRICKDIKRSVRAVCKKKNLEIGLEDNFGGMVLPLDINNYILFLSSDYVDYDTLFHEIYHCTRFIGESRFIKDEESFAWLQGYIGNEIMKCLKDKVNIRIS